MSTTRPVRIARPAAAPPPSGEERRTSFAGGWVRNRAGELRAGRLFGLFLLVLVVIYGVFVALAELGSSSGVRSAPVAWGVFSLLAVLFAVWGWSITFGKTPRSAQRRETDILVRERLGRVRRFPVGSAVTLKVVQHNGGGILGPLPTQVVEIVSREHSRRTYIVGERFFEQLVGS